MISLDQDTLLYSRDLNSCRITSGSAARHAEYVVVSILATHARVAPQSVCQCAPVRSVEQPQLRSALSPTAGHEACYHLMLQR
jgi:hypothetical protein